MIQLRMHDLSQQKDRMSRRPIPSVTVSKLRTTTVCVTITPDVTVTKLVGLLVYYLQTPTNTVCVTFAHRVLQFGNSGIESCLGRLGEAFAWCAVGPSCGAKHTSDSFTWCDKTFYRGLSVYCTSICCVERFLCSVMGQLSGVRRGP